MPFQKRFYRHRGITILQKRDPELVKLRRSKVAVVLAGGAISGGAFKVGGLRALDEMFASRRGPSANAPSTPFSLVDADVFVGLSAGSMLASVLAAGIAPSEAVRISLGTSTKYDEFTATEFMAPAFRDAAHRFWDMLRRQEVLLTNFLSGATDPAHAAPFGPGGTLWKMSQALGRAAPVGLFSTERLGAYLRRNMHKNGLPDDFGEQYARTGKQLMLTAVDVNRGELLVFGHDEPYADVKISDAIRASCALPGFYAPVRLKNPRAEEPGEPPFLDLVDGGVMRTANVRVAVEKGADLVICYNPFTRIKYERDGRSLVDHGPYALASQLFRILLGARLDLAKELLYRDETIDADVVFIEPADDDFVFFRMNPLRHANKERAAQHGYESIRNGIIANHERLAAVFQTHGIQLRPMGVPRRPWQGTEVMAHEMRESRGR
jgi:NTE family protein